MVKWIKSKSVETRLFLCNFLKSWGQKERWKEEWNMKAAGANPGLRWKKVFSWKPAVPYVFWTEFSRHSWQSCILKKISKTRERIDRKQSSCFSSYFYLPLIKHLNLSILLLCSPLSHSSVMPLRSHVHTLKPPTTFILLLWLRQRSGRPVHQREGALSEGVAWTVRVGGLQSGPTPVLT